LPRGLFASRSFSAGTVVGCCINLGFYGGRLPHNVSGPEAYDLTGSYRAAAELAGCDHHTVVRYVAMRANQPYGLFCGGPERS
jgi:hypothetical protein